MSILSVDQIQPIGSGTTITLNATEVKTGTEITVGTGASIFSPAGNILTFGTNNVERLRITNDGTFTVQTGGSERARIDSSGRLLVGTNSSSSSVRAVFQGYSGGGDNFQARVQFQTNQATNLASGNHLANFLFTNASNSVGAQIDVKADAAWGTNDYPARIEFKTTADSANSPTERLRIASGGEVSIGGFAPTAGAGILQIAGGLRVAGSGSASDTNTPYIYRTSGVDNLNFATSGTERLRINSSGQVQIGNSASGFTTKLIAGTGSGDNGITVYSGTSNNAFLHFADGDSGSDRYRGYVNYSHSDNSMQFATNDTESLRIDSSGRILKGLTSPRGNYGNNTSGVEYGVQIEGTSAIAASVSIVRNSNDSNDGGIILGKTRATSNGGNTVVQAGDDLGNLTFAGNDGSTMLFGAEIVAEVQSGVGNDDMPTDLIFKTNEGSTGTSERFRISSSGNLWWKSGACKQRKSGNFLGISGAGTSDIKISGNFENNDLIRVRWAYNWNAGDGGAWGEAVIWKQYEGTKRVRYLTDVKASPLSSVSFPHSGNDIWLRWQTNGGINGWYMIDVECHGCEPFPF